MQDQDPTEPTNLSFSLHNKTEEEWSCQNKPNKLFNSLCCHSQMKTVQRVKVSVDISRFRRDFRYILYGIGIIILHNTCIKYIIIIY